MSEDHVPEERKRVVTERAHGCCEYCQCQSLFSPDPFSVEHIVPRSRGGTSDLSNLALSCQGCNNRKYTSIEAIDPVR
jgi:5-methylcytosine-specific restriction endonuclease McrA